MENENNGLEERQEFLDFMGKDKIAEALCKAACREAYISRMEMANRLKESMGTREEDISEAIHSLEEQGYIRFFDEPDVVDIGYVLLDKAKELVLGYIKPKKER